jgi:uncharacterized membrane protein
MDLSAVTLSASWTVVGWIIALPLLAGVLWRAPWSRFGSSEAAHVWYGSIVALTLLWYMRASLADGFAFHLLGAAAFTLMSGGPLALVGGAVVVALTTLTRDVPVANAALVWLIEIVLPAGVVLAVLAVVERRMPPNFFVYIFIAAFFGAGLAFGVAGITAAAVLVGGAEMPADVVFGDYVPYLIYLAFAESTLTGMVLTLAVVYRPQWVATFDDERYLRGR